MPVVECRINQSGLNSQVGEDSDVLQQSSSSILPQFEKYTIKILKQPNQLLGIFSIHRECSGTIILILGMEVEALAWNLSGCLIRELDPEGAVALDGRIKTGKSLNSYCLKSGYLILFMFSSYCLARVKVISRQTLKVSISRITLKSLHV